MPISAAVRPWIEAWLRWRGSRSGALFVAIRHGRIRRDRIGPSGLWRVVSRRAKAAGIRPTAPHDCRRTAATGMLAAGADLGVVGRLLGHANVATTLRYDLRGQDAQRRAAELLVLPSPAGGAS